MQLIMSLLSAAPDALIAGTPVVAEITHPFWLFDWSLIFHSEVLVCSVILFFSAILCSAAGIGGGGIYVAVLMVCGGLSPHNAVPLSKAVVFFGAIASLVVNLYKQATSYATTPGGKTVIDTDACRLVVPATLIGTFLGVLLNRHTSDYVIVCLLTSLLAMMTGMVLRTARNQSAEESQAENQSAGLTLPAPRLQDPGSSSSIEEPPAAEPDVGTPLLGQPQEQQVDLSAVVPKARKKSLNSKDAGMGGALLCVVIVGGILRFHMRACRSEVLGDATQVGACIHPVNKLFQGQMHSWMSDATKSMVLQQLVGGIPMWACVAITVHFGFVANREVGWQPRSVVMYQVVSVLTGLLAGLVGVGGGLILSPFFLLTGMEPAIAVGTSATCVLFTSSSTTMQYIFTDRIMMSLALVYGMVTLVASYLGTMLVHQIQDKYTRKSYITYIVAVGVGISAVLSVIKFVYLVGSARVDPALSGAVATY